MSADVLSRLHPSLRASFVALPSDANVPLTAEQMDALFAGDRRAWADHLRDLFLASAQESAHQPGSSTQPNTEAEVGAYAAANR